VGGSGQAAGGEAPGDGLAELCVAVVEHRTPLGRSVEGVCSTWLAAVGATDHEDGAGDPHASVRASPKAQAAECAAWIVPGSFPKPPADPRTPQLLVGPGTGIAPLLALARAHAAQHTARQPDGAAAHAVVESERGLRAAPGAAAAAPITVFFGARHAATEW